jgi:hypothetical protein
MENIDVQELIFILGVGIGDGCFLLLRVDGHFGGPCSYL